LIRCQAQNLGRSQMAVSIVKEIKGGKIRLHTLRDRKVDLVHRCCRHSRLRRDSLTVPLSYGGLTNSATTLRKVQTSFGDIVAKSKKRRWFPEPHLPHARLVIKAALVFPRHTRTPNRGWVDTTAKCIWLVLQNHELPWMLPIITHERTRKRNKRSDVNQHFIPVTTCKWSLTCDKSNAQQLQQTKSSCDQSKTIFANRSPLAFSKLLHQVTRSRPSSKTSGYFCSTFTLVTVKLYFAPNAHATQPSIIGLNRWKLCAVHVRDVIKNQFSQKSNTLVIGDWKLSKKLLSRQAGCYFDSYFIWCGTFLLISWHSVEDYWEEIGNSYDWTWGFDWARAYAGGEEETLQECGISVTTE